MLRNGNKVVLGTPLSSATRWSISDVLGFTAPQRSPTKEVPLNAAIRRSREMVGFSTPQRITIMGREHEIVEFRTPQHPLTGSNNWGGASPLLSKHIPEESLKTSYLRFNAKEAINDSELEPFPVPPSPIVFEGKRSARRGRGWVFPRMGWRWRSREEKVLGNEEERRKKKKKKKQSGLVPGGRRSRWPQGW